MNLPNKLTVARLVLTGVFFVFIASTNQVLQNISLGLFIIAAFTDLADGYFARKYGMVTDFGRVSDPFADKILVCGALIFLLAKNGAGVDSRVRAWMVVLILAREFLVSGLRSLAESRNIPFGANYWGKLKALSQNFAVGFSILYVANTQFSFLKPVVDAVLYLAVAMTAVSGIIYVMRAKRILGIDA